jgi:hypothetical protein
MHRSPFAVSVSQGVGERQGAAIVAADRLANRNWSGREDSNLRPLPPEEKGYSAKARKSLIFPRAFSGTSEKYIRFSCCFTGATPERHRSRISAISEVHAMLESIL